MSDAQSPQVLLLDDDAPVRDGLAVLLQSVGLRCQTFANPYQFLNEACFDGIGCIVLDIRMPGISGLEVLERLPDHCDMPAIMLTGSGNVDACRRAFKSGALDFLQKPVDSQVLIDVVQGAVREHMARREKNSVAQQARQRMATLSAREREVLHKILDGTSTKEIARHLDLSPRTVESHRARIFSKLDVSSLVHLVRHYMPVINA
jgi:two-component system, LuxR family, response regulator FixJ